MRLPAYQQFIFIRRPAGCLNRLIVDDPHRSLPRFIGPHFRNPQGSLRRWPRIAPNDLRHNRWHNFLTSVRACNRTAALQGAGSLLCALRHHASVCRRCKAGQPAIFQRMFYWTRLAGKTAAANCHMFVKGLSAVADKWEREQGTEPTGRFHVQSFACSIVSCSVVPC